MSKSIIIYYSRAGENYLNGKIVDLIKGNTEIVADTIANFVHGDLFKIEQTIPYSYNYNECTEEAHRDQVNRVRPKLKKYLENVDEYDVIYLGYPNYWNTMPMAMFTFLENIKPSGKIIKPFCTHEGSGLGRSEEDIKRLCPNCIVKEGLAVRGSLVNNSKGEIVKWLEK